MTASGIRDGAFYVLVALLSLGTMREYVAQEREDTLVHDVAARVIRSSHARTPTERVLALRDYVRTHVGAPALGDDQPVSFLRATAEETLQAGVGTGGAHVRLFVNLARSMGIPAQRLRLVGREEYVAAEVELVPHEVLVVDPRSPPLIDGIETVEQVILRPEFDDYYSINLRRIHLDWLISRVRLEIGPQTYFLENPHAAMAAVYAAILVLVVGARVSVRVVPPFLTRRGWVHRSTLSGMS